MGALVGDLLQGRTFVIKRVGLQQFRPDDLAAHRIDIRRTQRLGSTRGAKSHQLFFRGWRTFLGGTSYDWGIGIALDFGWLFNQFHLLSFSNDLWQLNPAHDYLVRLFPWGFWRDAATYVMASVAVGAVVLAAIGGGYLLTARKRARQGGDGQ